MWPHRSSAPRSEGAHRHAHAVRRTLQRALPPLSLLPRRCRARGHVSPGHAGSAQAVGQHRRARLEMQTLGREEKGQKGHLQLTHLDSLPLVRNYHWHRHPRAQYKQVTILLSPNPLDVHRDHAVAAPARCLPPMTGKNQISQC